MIEYRSVDLKKWTVLAPVSKDILHSVVLAHVFGNQGESAYIVTSKDEVFAVGANVFGRLGIGNINVLCTGKPIKLSELCGKHVICFTTGSIHSIALTESGTVYSWGKNNFGELGYCSDDSQCSPRKVIFPDKKVEIKYIATGDRYSLALSGKNELYHWGDVEWDSCSQLAVPTLLTISPTVVSICCGGFHAAALTDNGEVLTWGSNDAGQLGNGTTTRQILPQLVGGQLADQVVVKIACSVLATVALTNEGVLYAWGHNKNSSLIVGMPIEEIRFPQRVIIRKTVVDIAANNLQTMLCAEAEKPHSVLRWAVDDDQDVHVPQTLSNCSNILEAFYDSSMPVMMRKSGEVALPGMPLLQGSPRDIGKVLFDVKEFSDLQIELADGVVYVHTVIMRAFCDHFKTLLCENWSDGRWTNFYTAVIKMTQYNSKAYRAFLRYVYTGIVEPLEGTEIIALCDIAMSYLELELKDLCQEMFDYCLAVSNVAQLYALAVGDESELVESCIKFTSENLESVILSEGFISLDPVLSKALICNAMKLKHHIL